jgi:hypothetical protein
MEPKEFCDLMQFASEVGHGDATADVIPHPTTLGAEFEREDGSIMGFHFTDVPMNRIGIAITRRFRAEREKGWNFLVRYIAFTDLNKDRRMKSYVRKGPAGYLSINEAVLHAAARSPLTPKMRFDRDAFFALAAKIRKEDEPTGEGGGQSVKK